ncbi:hypothetical protein BDQ17DRAFT_1362750 [Cyathus striatus]|nr:hypothetical protein BDQ17DRAFT_1362750 [Cyathus striatus]
MYVLCRYYPIIAWPVLLWAYCINHNPSFCLRVVHPVHALMLPFQLLGQAVVFVRTYGFSARSRRILACLIILYALVVVSNVWLFCIHITAPSTATYAPFYAIVGGTGCFPDYSAKLMGMRIGLAMFTATLMDVFSLTIVSMYCYQRHGARTSLATYFVKQGFGSFICVTSVNVFAMSLYFRHNSTHNGIGLPFILVVSSMMACRLILQLRQRAARTDTEISRENSLIVRNAIGPVLGTDESIATV